MLTEVMDALQVKSGGLYIDATFGGGGHTREIRIRGGKILAIDADPDAVKRVEDLGGSITFRGGNFRDIKELATSAGFQAVDGILFDLGLSSMEIDDPEKGFSFRFPQTPLDMRYSGVGRTAADIVREETRQTLQEIFEMFGEEERSREIAAAISLSRGKKPLETAGDLRTLIIEVGGDDHVTARIFQALRIAVNDEINALDKALIDGSSLLKKGSRVVVLSYHSLEDRVVKRFVEQTPLMRWVLKKPMVPTAKEKRDNRRSRSAKMRVFERV